MIGSSHPLNTHTRSTSYIYKDKALGILYEVGSHMSVSLLSIITIALAKFGVRR